ncbi:rho guanine nucleotide exchange factor 12 [Latimeria chalumnae]|uniref:rho guanine nucleotide exchange factor 12 n=1 Tax=Latimeria chalumnae TaxID=7897 RepID=UPI00313E3532
MRAGVQTGDRIIKVNGTLVTHSNHIEVVKLIKSGSYVALTVLGRPPGSPQIPLADPEGDLGAFGQCQSSAMTSQHSPGQGGNDRNSTDRITGPVLMGEENNIVHNQKVEILRKMLQRENQQLQLMKEEGSRNPTPRTQKDIQEAKKHITQLQEQLDKATGTSQDGVHSPKLLSDPLQIREAEVDGADSEQSLHTRNNSSGTDRTPPNSTVSDLFASGSSIFSESPCQRDVPSLSPKVAPKDGTNSYSHPDADENQDTDSQSSVGSPSARVGPQIIGAEDDDFDTEQEQINGQCSCFQSIELLKCRPAHLAVFLHHVVSQFDPAPLLCYLHTDLYKQTSSKETRRIFMEFHQFFLDRGANLKLLAPEAVAVDLEKRRPEFIPEELHRQHIQAMQESVLPEVQRLLEDFRQKRSMGLTLAESELSKLDSERVRDRVALERERASAEQIISKIEEVLITLQSSEEEKSLTVHYLIVMYMKHLGVKLKESRNLEHKRVRMSFLPKIKQSIKKEREGEEKVKKRVFPSILGPPRRPSRQDSGAIGRAMELQNKRHTKQPSQTPLSPSDSSDASKLRQSFLSSDGTDTSHLLSNQMSPQSVGSSSQESSRECESGSTPVSAVLRQPGETSASTDSSDSVTRIPNLVFDFPSPPLEQLQEEDREGGRLEVLPYGEVHSDEEGYNFELDGDPPSWQQLVSRELLSGLKAHEIKRQEVINELFYTERAHVRMLKVLDQVFYQRMSQDGILPPSDLKHIFSNLDEVLQLHVDLNEQMKAIRKKSDNSVIDQIGELLSWFSRAEEGKLKKAAATFCSNQPFALELIKSRQKKDSRFQNFMLEAESNPLCRRLQLKDIIPTEMQRLTKYPLLLENIAKYSEQEEEKDKVKKAADCCRQILNFVNQAVKEAENKQHLEDYQRRLDLSYLKQSESPMLDEFRNLDLTKRKMIHEGPLTWKVNRDKTIDLYTLLLEDILVLLQKQDDRLVLRCHSKNLAGTADTKHIFSPVIKLSTVLVRPVATNHRGFFVISMSDNGAHIYELVAQTISERKTWQYLVGQQAGSGKTKPHNKVIALPQQAPPPAHEEEEEEEMNPVEHQKNNQNVSRVTTGIEQPQEKEPGLESAEKLKAEEEEGHCLQQEVAGRTEFAQMRGMEAITQESETMLHYRNKVHDLPLFPHQNRATEALRNLELLKELLNHLFMVDEDVFDSLNSFQRFSIENRALLHQESLDSSPLGIPEYQPHNLRPQLTLEEIPQRNGKPQTPSDSAAQDGVRVLSSGGSRTEHLISSDVEESEDLSPVAGPEEGQGEIVADEGGEQFFDAPEAHSDVNLSGFKRMENPEKQKGEEEEVQAQPRVQGKYLILDGYGEIQESCTDDDLDPSQMAECSGHVPTTDCMDQSRNSMGESRSDPRKFLSSSDYFSPLQSSRGDSLPGIRKLLCAPDVWNQIEQHIHQIQVDLEHLKETEERYSELSHRLAGSAPEEEDKS